MAGLCSTNARYACFLDDPAPSQQALLEAQRLRIDVAAAEVTAAFDAAGIPSILLKGPAIAHWLYEDGERRAYGDVDLLVSPGRFEAAERALAQLGFRHRNLETTRLGQESHHEHWRRDVDGALVELHRTLLGVGVDDQTFWDAVAGETERMPLGAGLSDAQVLTAPGRAFVVALHAAQHGPMPAVTNDLERALAKLPVFDWAQAASLAENVGASAPFAHGLSLVPAGRETAALLGLSTAAGTALHADSAPRTTFGWERLSQTAGFSARLRFLARELVPTADVLRSTDPLAQRGVLGLAVAYLRRPLVLARHAPAGLRAWRRSRGPRAG
jgi:hypothetical protein